MSAAMHSGSYARSSSEGDGLRVCPACGTEYPPARPDEGPITLCPNDGFAVVRKSDLIAAQGDLMLGRTVAQRFTIVARLGTGSMGAVYRAWQERMARWVAIKIMRYDRTADVDSRKRFEREARAMSQLQSPHTVTVYDFGEAEDGSVYLAMELLEGESLGARLAREGRLPIRDAVHFARGALTSLAEAHAKGIIHRDLKPDNLFLTEVPDVGGAPSREICKLLDFGIAKVIREERAIDVLETQAGTVFGTPRYMSPEQAQGFRLDARSDIYSLGVILYQMVTGQPPFEDEEAVVVMARHIKTKPVPPRELAPEAEIPAALDRVILRAMAKDPIDRPETAEIFILALDAAEQRFPATLPAVPSSVQTQQTGSVSHPLPTLAPTALRRRRRLLWVFSVLVFFAVTVGGVLIWRSLGFDAVLGVTNGNPSSDAHAAAAASAEPTDDIVFEVQEAGIAPSSAASSSSTAAGDVEGLVVSPESLPVAGRHGKGAAPAGTRPPRKTPAVPALPTGSSAHDRNPTQPATTPSAAPPPPSTGQYGRFE